MKLFAPATKQRRERLDIDPGAFHQLQDILKDNRGNLSLEELKNCYSPHGGIRLELEKIYEKHGNANNWLKSVEGKNIEIHFFYDGYDDAKSYFYHVDGGEIKRNTFGGCANETMWRRKYIDADGNVTKKAFEWGSPVDEIPEVENNKTAKP